MAMRLLSALNAQSLDRRVEHAADGGRLGRDRPLLALLLELREEQQVVDDGVEPVRLAGDDAEELLRGLRLAHGAVEQRLHEPLDRGDRRAEFVGDVRHEVAPEVFEPADARHVVQDHHRAHLAAGGVVQHRAVRRQPALAVFAEEDFALRRRVLARQRLRDELLKLRVPHDFLDRPALRLGRRRAEQRAGRLVHAQHALAHVHGQHALDHAQEDGLLLVALRGDEPDAVLELRGHLVDHHRQAADLLGGRHVEPVREFAGGQALDAAFHLLDRPRDAPETTSETAAAATAISTPIRASWICKSRNRAVNVAERHGRAQDEPVPARICAAMAVYIMVRPSVGLSRIARPTLPGLPRAY